MTSLLNSREELVDKILKPLIELEKLADLFDPYDGTMTGS